MAWFRFWIKSSKGTDKSEIVHVNNDLVDEENVKCILEDWCEQFGAWHVSENIVRYGSERLMVPPRKAVLDEIEKLTKKRKRLDATLEELKTELGALERE